MMKQRSSDSEPTAEPRRRPGRFRRWLVRPLFWAAAAAALLLLLAVALVNSGYAREWARAQLERQLGERLDRSVAIAGVEFDLIPPMVEIEGLVIADLDPTDPPLLAIDRLLIEARVVRGPSPTIGLDRVLVQGPRASLRFTDEGVSNLPDLGLGEGGGGALPVKIEIGRLEIEDGVVEIDDRRLPLELSASDLQASLYGLDGPRLRGRLAADEVSVLLPRGRPYLGSVAVDLGLEPGLLRILGGRVGGPELSAEVSGQVRWGEERSVKLDFEGSASAALFTALGYLEDQIRGAFELDGGLVWTPEAWGLRGDLAAREVEVLDRRLRDLSGVVSGDSGGIRLEVERAVYGGGSVEGEVVYALPPGGAAASPPSTAEMRVDLRLAGVALERLLADQGIPLGGVDGGVSGPVSYHFPFGSPLVGAGWADLTVTERRPPRPGFLSVRGRAPFTIRDGVLRTEALRLAGQAQSVVASGSFALESGTGSFDYEVESSSLAELVGLLPGMAADDESLWAPRTGRGRLEGTLFITPGATSTRLTLDLSGVEAKGYAADRLQGALRVGPGAVEDLRLELSRPGSALLLSGSIGLPGADSKAPEGWFSLAVDSAGWPLAEARPWLPFDLPLEGGAYGSLRLSGPAEAVGVEVELEVRPAILLGVAVDQARIDLSFGPEGLEVRRSTIESPAGVLWIEGGWERAADLFALDLGSDGLDLEAEPVAALAPPGLRGAVAVAASLTGSWESPKLDGRLDFSRLALSEHPLGDAGEARLEGSWDGAEVTLRGSLLGLATIDGGGRLDRERVALAFDASGSDLGELARQATGGLADLSGSWSGKLRVDADLTAGETPKVSAELATLELRTGELELRNLEPVRFELGPLGLRIESLYLGQEGRSSEVFIAGDVSFGNESALDLNLQATLASEWLQPLLPGVELRGGEIDAIASIGGTASAPRVNGLAELRNSSLLAPALPFSLENLRATLLFYPQQIVVDRAVADAAGGKLYAGGTIDLRGLPELGYSIQVSGERIDVRYPEGWLLRGDAELSVVSVPGGREIRGVVELDRAYYLEDVDLGLRSLFQALFEKRRLEVESTDELLTGTGLDLLVRGPEALRVRNNMARVDGANDHTVRGNLARPIVFGRVDLVPGGELVFGGNEYEVERGRLNFVNPYRIEPVIDLVATTSLREYDITLNLSGTQDKLSTQFSSDPPVADLQVLALLTGGESSVSDAAVGAEDSGGVGAAESFLYGQASSLIATRVNRLFSLDKLRIDPLTGSSGDLSSARLTVGKRLSRDLFATYSFDPSTTEQQILELEWSVSPTLVLVFTQGADGTYSLDARWEKAF